MNAPIGAIFSWGRLSMERRRAEHERRKRGYVPRAERKRFASPEQHKRKRWGAGWDRTEHPSIARKRRLGMIR